MSRVRVCAWNPLGWFATIDVSDYYYYYFQTSLRSNLWKKGKNFTVWWNFESSPIEHSKHTCARSLEAGPLQETTICCCTKIPRRCRQLPAAPPPFSRTRTHSRDQWSVIILAKCLLFPCTDIDNFYCYYYYFFMYIYIIIHPLHLTSMGMPNRSQVPFFEYCKHRVKKKNVGRTPTYVHYYNK